MVVVAIGMVAVAALAFRDITRRSLWVDEGVTAFAVTGSTRNLWTWMKIEPHFALYELLLRGWTTVAGHGELALRLPSAMCVVATVPVLHAIARRLVDRRAAEVSVGVFAVHGFVLGYAQEARSYALMVLLSSLATLLLLRALDAPGRRDRWALWLVVLCLAALAHPFGALLAVAHAAILLLHRREVPWATVARLAAVPVVVVGLLVGRLVQLGTHRIEWIPTPSLHGVRIVARELTGTAHTASLVAYGAAIGVAVLAAARRPAGAVERRGVAIAACLAGLPLLTALLLSTVQPVFLSRYLLVAVPGLVLLVGAGVARLPARAGGVAMVVLAAVLVPQAFRPFRQAADHDFRGAIRIVAGDVAGDDLVVPGPGGRPAVLYYLRADLPAGRRPPVWNLDALERRQGALRVPCAHPVVWFVNHRFANPSFAVGPLLGPGYRLVEVRRVAGIRVERFDDVRC